MDTFGKIKNILRESLLETQIKKSEEHKKIVSIIINEIKKNPILNTQFNIYSNIENRKNKNETVNLEYIKESINILKNLDVKAITLENEKLISKIKGLIDLDNIEYKDSYKNLHESLNFLVKTDSDINTLDSVYDEYHNILDFIGSNNKDSLIESFSIEDQLEIVDSDPNISDENKKIIQNLCESSDTGKMKIFNEIKNKCLEIVNIKLDECSDLNLKETLLDTKESLLKMDSKIDENFVKKTCKIIELEKDLKNVD